jgi:DNA polymerase III alpha subunit
MMKFLTVEDAWGVFEAVLFSEAYQRFGHLTEPGGTRLYIGVVRSEHGDAALVVERIARAE